MAGYNRYNRFRAMFKKNSDINFQLDSRKIKPGDIFFAYKGEQTDGRDFIDQASPSYNIKRVSKLKLRYPSLFAGKDFKKPEMSEADRVIMKRESTKKHREKNQILMLK